MGKAKVTVVGAGFVGATTAQRLVEKEIANVVLVDIIDGLAKGKALDIMQSASIEGFGTTITGTTDYKDTKDSEVIVITAGLARKPGMTRDDLLARNAEIVGGIVTECVPYSPNAIIILVTNPLDIMTYLAWKKSGFPARRVFGMAGELDSARYACFIGEELACQPNLVRAMVLGGHGDDMVPVPEASVVKGVPITTLIPGDTIEKINERTRVGGAEIVKYLKTGSAYYAPSSAVTRMVRNVLEDKGEVIPVSTYLTGQYGLKDVFCGVPAHLGRAGVREVVEIKLTEEQSKALHASAERVRAGCQSLHLK